VRVRPLDDLLLGDPAAVLLPEHDQRLDRLAALGVRRGDDAGLEDLRVVVQQCFHLGRPDLVAGRVDHPLEPVDHEEVAILVDPGEVAGAQEAPAVDLDEGLGGGRVVMPVALHDPWAADDDLPGPSPGGISRSETGIVVIAGKVLSR
jgi:hypothetical protein